MELKQYQRDVLTDLNAFLECLGPAEDVRPIGRAFRLHWENKGVVRPPRYNHVIDGVPRVCLKVPTGGGKTLVAARALLPVFNWINPFAAGRRCLAVWLAPSQTIVEQTLKAFKDPAHPYRRALKEHFKNRVDIYDKAEIIQSISFTPDTLLGSLSVVVFTYDSLRARNKEDRKLHQANGALDPFAAMPGIDAGDKEAPSVVDVIRSLNPVVIVDESHNARTALSLDMVAGLNPSFVLELTATPRDDANIISYANPFTLKKEHMVKLPVVVRPCRSIEVLMDDAIDLRRRLEHLAVEAEATDAGYVRPIVLFQAESDTGGEDRETFERVRTRLMRLRIAKEEIAVKTATVNELKGVNLLARDCPVRFIITVNALKEGWDCPFAYVLASLADRQSVVDVEQILGRVLRQPYARQHPERLLTMSYVLTTSVRFKETIEKIVQGLNVAGFGSQDYRVPDDLEVGSEDSVPKNDTYQSMGDLVDAADTVLTRSAPVEPSIGAVTQADDIVRFLAQAAVAGDAHDSATTVALAGGKRPDEEEKMLNRVTIVPRFAKVVAAICLPQFHIKLPTGGYLIDGPTERLLDKENLLREFRLSNHLPTVTFGAVGISAIEVDVAPEEAKDQKPRIRVLSGAAYAAMVAHLRSLAPEAAARQLAGQLAKMVGDLPPVLEKDIGAFIHQVVAGMEPSVRDDCMGRASAYASHLRKHIHDLMAAHAERSFQSTLNVGTVFLKPSYRFPSTMTPTKVAMPMQNQLYQDSWDTGTRIEFQMATALDNASNVTFWHRNPDRAAYGGFFINGPFNHFPDFIARLDNGMILMIETKGDNASNTDSSKKLRLGQQWAAMAGANYRYFMVFESTPIERAMNLDQFATTLRMMV